MWEGAKYQERCFLAVFDSSDCGLTLIILARCVVQDVKYITVCDFALMWGWWKFIIFFQYNDVRFLSIFHGFPWALLPIISPSCSSCIVLITLFLDFLLRVYISILQINSEMCGMFSFTVLTPFLYFVFLSIISFLDCGFFCVVFCYWEHL